MTSSVPASSKTLIHIVLHLQVPSFISWFSLVWSDRTISKAFFQTGEVDKFQMTRVKWSKEKSYVFLSSIGSDGVIRQPTVCVIKPCILDIVDSSQLSKKCRLASSLHEWTKRKNLRKCDPIVPTVKVANVASSQNGGLLLALIKAQNDHRPCFAESV